MKIKNLFITLGLALAAVGVAAGVGAANSSAKEVRVEATTDSSIEIRFTRPGDWGDNVPHIHTYLNDESEKTEWPGYAMTFLWNNEYSQSVFSWHPSESEPLYDNIMFNNNNNGMKSDALAAPSSPTQYWYYSGWQSAEIEYDYIKIYLYDYDNAFEGTPHVYAWQNNTNNGYPGVEMTAEEDFSGNGLVYSYNLNTMFNQVQFNIGSNSKEVNAGAPTANYCYVYAPTSDVAGEGSWWNNINYVYAHNWSQKLLLMGTVSTDVQTDTHACETAYYVAKETYQYFVDHNTYVCTQINSNFQPALARMAAWAEHEGETFDDSNSDGIYSFSSAFVSIAAETSSLNNTTLIIVLASVITLAAVGGYFLLRRKED